MKSDRYEILDVIASGGMATVWRARDTKLNRLVALKRPHPAPSGSDRHRRFEQEAQIAATVTHVNLVTVFDAGTDDDGPFLVMELVDAPTLASGTVEAADVVLLGAQVASALAALHDAGIVHRDVKPSNILLAEHGAKLTDFGIARSPVVGAGLTQSGMVMGTPEYAAPEVLAGAEPTPASDVYSLGAVLRDRLGVTGSEPTDTLVGLAMSSDPADRPTAAEFAARLRSLPPLPSVQPSSTPTVAMPVPLDATAEMPVALQRETLAGSTVPPPADEAPPARQRGRLVPVVLALAFVVAAFAIAAALTSTDDEGVDGAVAPPSTTIVDATTSEPIATAGDQSAAAPPAAEAEPEDSSLIDVVDDVEEVVTLIEEAPRNVLKKKDGEAIIERVVDGVASAVSGSVDRAEEQLRSAVERIDDKLDSEQLAARARSLIRNLGSRLGLDPDEIAEDQP